MICAWVVGQQIGRNLSKPDNSNKTIGDSLFTTASGKQTPEAFIWLGFGFAARLGGVFFEYLHEPGPEAVNACQSHAIEGDDSSI